jgi:hypothetical protein
MCDWEIVDLFVTNDTQEANEKKEEDWQGAVWSVEVQEVTENTTSKTAAFVANWETSWIMTCDKTHPMKDLQVGDTVRIGTSEAGHTNHRIILEKRKIERIYSGINQRSPETRFAHGTLKMITGTNPEVTVSSTQSHFTYSTLVRPNKDSDDLPYVVSARTAFNLYHGPDVITAPNDFGSGGTVASDNVTGGLDVSADAIYAYRINARVNATEPPIQFNYRHLNDSANDFKQSKALLDNRHLLQLNTDWAYQDQKGDRNTLQLYYGSGLSSTTAAAYGFGGFTTIKAMSFSSTDTVLQVFNTTNINVGDELLLTDQVSKTEVVTVAGFFNLASGEITVTRGASPQTFTQGNAVFRLDKSADNRQFVFPMSALGYLTNVIGANVRIGSEVLTVSQIDTTSYYSLSITEMERAQLDTTASSHAHGATATLLDKTKVTLTSDGFMLRRKQLPQPVFRTRRYTDSPSKSLQVDLDTGMKAMKWLKLMSYSVYGKQRVGVADTHEYGHQDWLAMSIDQINGKTISNNPYAQNAFYVLHGGTAAEDEMGTIELHERSDTALVTHEFKPEQALKQLNFRFTNREGEPSKFNRIHLWFKACVKRS